MPTFGSQKVYVIQHELGPVKIGIAKDPEHRMREIQVATPFKLKLRKTKEADDAREVEEYLHNRFQKYHMRGEWFDIPPDQRDFEIPNRIRMSGKPDVEVEISKERDVDNEWAEILERLFKAMKKTTKHRTPGISKVRGEWREIGEIDENNSEEDTDSNSTPDLHEVKEDTPDKMKRCSRCGFHFDRSEGSCPTCGSGSFTDGSNSY